MISILIDLSNQLTKKIHTCTHNHSQRDKGAYRPIQTIHTYITTLSNTITKKNNQHENMMPGAIENLQL